MLQSTFCGKSWAGNAANRVYVNSFDENKRDSDENLNKEEVNFYKSLVNDCGRYLNYNFSCKKDQFAFDRIDIGILDHIKVNIFYLVKNLGNRIMIILRKKGKHNYAMIITRIIILSLVDFPKEVFKISWNINDKKRKLIVQNKYLRKNYLKRDIFL